MFAFSVYGIMIETTWWEMKLRVNGWSWFLITWSTTPMNWRSASITFAEKYESAKSSISEDIVIIMRLKRWNRKNIGDHYRAWRRGSTPSMSDQESKEIVEDLCKQLPERRSYPSGGYICLSDLWAIQRFCGRIIAKAWDKKIDAVMTVKRPRDLF